MPEASPKGRLTRLKIHQFRNVRAGTDLRFDAGINVLLGRNGTGKTTLLELLVAVAVGDLQKYSFESFELEFDIVLGKVRLSVHVENRVRPDHVAALLAGVVGGTKWCYSVSVFYEGGKTDRIRVSSEEGEVGDGSSVLSVPSSDAPLFVPGFYVGCLRAQRKVSHSEDPFFLWPYQVIANNCIRFDEGLDLFRGVTEGFSLPRINGTLKVEVLSNRGKQIFGPGGLSLLRVLSVYVPSSLLDCVVRQELGVEGVEIKLSHAEWSLLERVRSLLGAREMSVVLSLIVRRELGGDNVASAFGKPIFRVASYGGATYTHERLSYGEKRLLAFLYHAACNPEILVADELVNGLHYEWIEACLGAIQGQAFLSSQNPLLLDHLSFGSLEEAQRRFVLCIADDDHGWTWKSMGAEDAAAFYRAYEVGVQHVSEILKDKGMW